MVNQTNIMYKQLIKLTGTDGIINNVSCRFLVTENNDNDENNLDYKNIITDQPIKQGDYISLNDSINYMIIDKTRIIESDYVKCNFRKTLPVQIGNSLKNIEAIIDKKSIGLNETGQITDTHDQYQFIVPAIDSNGKSNNVGFSQIIYDKGLYKIDSVDTTRDDLIIYVCKFSAEYNPHVFTIELSEPSKTIVEGETYQVSAICKDNGNVVTNPPLVYSSSNTTIATIDYKGLITGIKAGNSDITVNYNNTVVTLSLTINAKPVAPVISYSAISSNGYSYRVKEGATLTYTKTIDSVVDNTLDVAFTLDATGTSLVNSSAISVVKKTSNTIQIRNLTVTTNKSFVLTVKDNSNGRVIATQSISTRPA